MTGFLARSNFDIGQMGAMLAVSAAIGRMSVGQMNMGQMNAVPARGGRCGGEGFTGRQCMFARHTMAPAGTRRTPVKSRRLRPAKMCGTREKAAASTKAAGRSPEPVAAQAVAADTDATGTNTEAANTADADTARSDANAEAADTADAEASAANAHARTADTDRRARATDTHTDAADTDACSSC